MTDWEAQYGPWTDPEDGQQWFGLSAQSHRNIQRNLARLKEDCEKFKDQVHWTNERAVRAEADAEIYAGKVDLLTAEVARLNEQLEDARAALDTAKHHAAVAEFNEKQAHEAVNVGDAAAEWATLVRVLMIIDQAIVDSDRLGQLDVLASVRKKIETLGQTRETRRAPRRR